MTPALQPRSVCSVRPYQLVEGGALDGDARLALEGLDDRLEPSPAAPLRPLRHLLDASEVDDGTALGEVLHQRMVEVDDALGQHQPVTLREAAAGQLPELPPRRPRRSR